VPDYSGEQFVELASPNFFQARNNNDKHYKTILSIFKFTIPFPLTSIFLFSVISIYFIQPKVYEYAKTARKNTFKVGNTRDNTDDKSEDVYIHLEGEQVKNSHVFSILATNITLTAMLMAFHIVSGIKYIQYGNEVLYNRDLSRSGYSSNSDDQALPIFHFVFSLFIITTTITFVTLGYVLLNGAAKYRRFKLYKSMAVLVSINVIYIGSYFSPYMLLAVIHDPLQTTFTYLFGLLLVACIYELYLGLSFFCGDNECWTHQEDRSKEEVNEIRRFAFCFCCASWTGVLSVIYIVITVIFIFTFGSFNNFTELQNLVFPLVIGILTIIFFKPVYKSAKLFHKNDDDTLNKKRKL